ncbi:MAG: NAD(+)/NADH kinase [Methanopyri archaeon]|nr:NAD(+)/NADH kinase [Methanopyri archaeon]
MTDFEPGEPPEVVGISGRTDQPEAVRTATEACRLFEERGVKVLVDKTLGIQGYENASLGDIGESSDLVVSIGGDGTILRISRMISEHEIPILGVNLGKFGFLTEVEADDLEEAVDRVCEGDYDVEIRKKLAVTVGGVPEGDVLNEVTVITNKPAKMIRYRLYVDDVEIEDVWADGILVATPTGSTAYSLSAGGPVVEPRVPASIITPLNPFKLSARPLVVSMDRTVTVKVDNPERAEVVLDGQEYVAMENPVEVTESNNVAKFVRFGTSFFDKFRAKFLEW